MDTLHDEHVLELSDWIFPELDSLSGGDEIDLNSLFTPEHVDIENKQDYQDDIEHAEKLNESYENLGHKAVPAGEAQAESTDKVDDQAAILHDEVKNLKLEYESRINAVNQLLGKLKAPLSMVDEEVIELMQDVVKKITKRIICKEISTDPSVFIRMLDELKKMIDSKNGLITIYLSSDDYHRLNADQTGSQGLASIDSSLQQGDVVIKSNFAEVRALLNDRIDQLVRIQHD
ncbi:hypothetical protein AQUSIP_24360 [Aquicella siphonis]|uniref:Flagellar assembly protein FliH n=1 Tax=Aquicella siphonis TaxID=254247 RepID=A0A5E4PJ61_9COXI|nr:FliH/SctL family protein [Aquicella siphonis]VVC77109.1 hypothetical protein AQUSIP_24360 [Aquicella siphonis]